MVKKFTKTASRFRDETELMTAVHARNRPGRPIKEQHKGAQYSVAWGDMRRIYVALKKGYLCTDDGAAREAMYDALRILHRRSAGRLELEEDAPMPQKGPPKITFEITWPGGKTEDVQGAAKAAERLGIRKNRLLERTKELESWQFTMRMLVNGAPQDTKVSVKRLT